MKKIQNHPHHKPGIKSCKSWLLTVIAGIAAIFLINYDVHGQAWGPSLESAGKAYEIGDYAKVISLLDSCFAMKNENKQPLEIKSEAWKLYANVNLVIDSLEEGKNAIRRLLSIDPAFTLRSNDDPLLKKWVNEIRYGLEKNQTSAVSKTKENIYEVPATMVTITEEEIRQRGYTRLDEILNDIPGFDVSQVRGITWSMTYMRGYRSDLNDRILLLINGVEDNGLSSNGIDLSPQYSVTNIKRVEVVYGPASTMYGANAFTGVINIVTKEPSDFLKDNQIIGIQSQAGYGSFQTRYADVSLAARPASAFSFNMTGRVYYSNEFDQSGFKDWDYSLPNTEKYEKSFVVTDSATAEKLNQDFPGNPYFMYDSVTHTARPTQLAINAARMQDSIFLANSTINGAPISFTNQTKDWLVSGAMHFSDLTFGFQTWKRNEGSLGWYNTKKGGSANGAAWVPNYSNIYLKYSKSFSRDRFSILLFSRYKPQQLTDKSQFVNINTFASGSLDLADLLDTISPNYSVRYYSRVSKQFRNEFRFMVNLPPNFNMIAGLEYRNSLIQGDFTQANTENPSETAVPNPKDLGGLNLNIRDLGAYAQASWRPFRPFKIVFGARGDHNRIRISRGYGTVFNTRAALVYTQNKFVFKAIYASAFLDASPYSKFSTTSYRLLPNPDLDPEWVKNFEVSATWHNDNSFTTVTLFNSHYSHVIGTKNDVTVDGVGPTQQFTNQGKLRISGVEANSKFNLTRCLSMHFNYSFIAPFRTVDSEGKDDNTRAADMAAHKFNLGANLGLLKKQNLVLNLRLNYVGPRKVGEGTSVPTNPGVDSTGFFPAFVLLNGSVSFALPKSGLTFQGVLYNLTNARYFTPGVRTAGDDTYAALIPQPGFNFMLKLIYDFPGERPESR
ncbi:MAG: TonB-dependent receptor [Bacteroidia bacterium]|nr:TonB-dependent receptor [Bacteroidia bacterium]